LEFEKNKVFSASFIRKKRKEKKKTVKFFKKNLNSQIFFEKNKKNKNKIFF